MKKLLAFLFPALLAAGAYAQTSTDSHGVATSTDPARAAAVERQAQELKAAQAAGGSKGIESVHASPRCNVVKVQRCSRRRVSCVCGRRKDV